MQGQIHPVILSFVFIKELESACPASLASVATGFGASIPQLVFGCYVALCAAFVVGLLGTMELVSMPSRYLSLSKAMANLALFMFKHVKQVAIATSGLCFYRVLPWYRQPCATFVIG